ncbi:MAG TPA: ATP-binding protein [Spongiibacteraceae bacterium]|nr:ATP-binding protein [Spongiibacteraceae bacterium]
MTTPDLLATRPEAPQQSIFLQNVSMLRIYAWYRVALSVLLISIVVLTRKDPLVGRDAPQLFVALCGAYFLFATITLLLLPLAKRLSKRALFGNFAFDITILTCLHHLSGGTTSGLGLLILVAVAASGLLLSGQVALLVPALGSMAILGDTVYLLQTQSLTNQSLLSAATQGILMFATSIGFQMLSQRLRTTQQIAIERTVDVGKLQNLNQLIVQRMRTGIVVVDSADRIKMINESAAELLHAEQTQQQLNAEHPPLLPALLEARLDTWHENPTQSAKRFRMENTGPELIARFTKLDQEESGDTLIFIEDSGLLAQRAQQMKLAALGRLTASIAHEIRNPLGAISHASQLLRESPELPESDERLVNIVINHSQRINSIIENVLKLSRRTAPNPRRIDLGIWLHDYVEQYRQGYGADAQIEIHEIIPVEVTVDTDQLSQVLTNLLDNALRYSKKATGTATARFVVSTNNKQLAQLDIIDDGAGIDSDDQEKIFEPFFTTESKGNGLGLYISRELCEINQARLHYLRTDAGKSCFRISFSHPDRKPLMSE